MRISECTSPSSDSTEVARMSGFTVPMTVDIRCTFVQARAQRTQLRLAKFYEE